MSSGSFLPQFYLPVTALNLSYVDSICNTQHGFICLLTVSSLPRLTLYVEEGGRSPGSIIGPTTRKENEKNSKYASYKI